MNLERREQILEAYVAHSRRFDELASRVNLSGAGEPAVDTGARQSHFDMLDCKLSERQRDVLALLAAGFSNQEIAAKLTISIETVKTHVQKILQCLGARNRAHAVSLAYARGLLHTSASAS